jgi:predicted acetyltransferase
MNISIASSKDTNQIKEIWKYCFKDPVNYVDFYFNNVFNPENTIVAKINENVIASMQLNPYTLNFKGDILDTVYIVGVSTTPQYRGHGVMSKMFDFAFEYLYKKGLPLAILTAEQPSLYQNFGFRHISSLKKYILPIENIIKYKTKLDIAIAKSSDYVNISKVYNSYLSDSNLYLVRDYKHIEKLHLEVTVEGGNLYVIRDNTKVVGYFIALLTEKSLFVREAIFLTKEAIERFLTYAYYHKGQIERLIVITSDKENLEAKVQWDITCKIELAPYMLARIINSTSFVKSSELKKPNDSFKVVDKFLNENNGIFSINNNTLIKANNYNHQTDIGTFTQFLLGSIDGKYALFDNLVKTNDPKSIAMYKKDELFINEYI